MSAQPCPTNLWRLAPEVHAVDVDGDLVLLDVRADAYYCLPDALAGGALALRGRTLAGCSPGVVEDLSAAALIVPGAGEPGSDDVRPPVPCASALRTTYPAPRMSDAPQAARALLDVLARYRGRRFAQILAAAGGRDPRRVAPAGEAVREVADRFQRWVPFAPVSGKCLLRSFMLLRLLRRQGLDALWVFGVRTWPFHAHCWLQCEDLVLDDHPDRVRAYAPILVV